MPSRLFDHETLDCYQLAIRFTASAHALAGELDGLNRHLRDQLLRASSSIPLNIAEGNGKRSSADRNRFLQIARGSALECAALMDCLLACRVVTEPTVEDHKGQLLRIVQMLTKMTG